MPPVDGRPTALYAAAPGLGVVAVMAMMAAMMARRDVLDGGIAAGGNGVQARLRRDGGLGGGNGGDGAGDEQGCESGSDDAHGILQV